MTEFWIEMSPTGTRFDLAEPQPEQVFIEDIAHHLAGENRFAGGGARPISVAEHSLYVAELVAELGAPPAVQLGALLHDAHEAYCKDIPRPLKALLGHVYREIAARIDNLVFARFGARYAPVVKIADDRALASEAAALMPSRGAGWPVDCPPAGWIVEAVKLHAHTPALAHERRFLAMFQCLQAVMAGEVR